MHARQGRVMWRTGLISGWFVVVMAFFVLARELPLLLGLTLHPGLAAALSLVGTALVAGLRRLFARRRTRRGTPPPGAPADPPALHATKLERKWS